MAKPKRVANGMRATNQAPGAPGAPGLCFVVMGFGKKTDYSSTPRTLNLDATYEAIIKPAVKGCGLTCVRADEVTHSGLIDGPMYEMLLRADLVIADISTANPNALYELGVRHALRPFSTIVIKEIDGNFIFDLSHLASLQYKHLGEDIGATEAKQKAAKLKELIRAVMASKSPDSPVHRFLTVLSQPPMSDEAYARAVKLAEARSESLARALEGGRQAAKASKSGEARDHFRRAYAIQKEKRRGDGRGEAGAVPDPYVIQQLALHTYKAGAEGPPEQRIAALRDAQGIIEELTPAASVDPETLGIAGAIRKRLCAEGCGLEHLDAAITFYGRGFEIKQDYYNGENYALCLDWRAEQQALPREADYDRLTARKARERIVASLDAALRDPNARERGDYRWMLATMANTLRVLGRDGDDYETQFRALEPFAWQVKTFEEGKAAALSLAEKVRGLVASSPALTP